MKSIPYASNVRSLMYIRSSLHKTGHCICNWNDYDNTRVIQVKITGKLQEIDKLPSKG